MIAFLNIGATELLVIMILAVLIFGKKLPEVARTAGKHIFEFRRSMYSIQNEIAKATDDVKEDLKDADAVVRNEEGEINTNLNDSGAKKPLSEDAQQITGTEPAAENTADKDEKSETENPLN